MENTHIQQSTKSIEISQDVKASLEIIKMINIGFLFLPISRARENPKYILNVLDTYGIVVCIVRIRSVKVWSVYKNILWLENTSWFWEEIKLVLIDTDNKIKNYTSL